MFNKSPCKKSNTKTITKHTNLLYKYSLTQLYDLYNPILYMVLVLSEEINMYS